MGRSGHINSCPKCQKLTRTESPQPLHLRRSLELPTSSWQAPSLYYSHYWGKVSVTIYYFSGAIDLLQKEPSGKQSYCDNHVSIEMGKWKSRKCPLPQIISSFRVSISKLKPLWLSFTLCQWALWEVHTVVRVGIWVPEAILYPLTPVHPHL